jgi:excisionase family DNA binding protein
MQLFTVIEAADYLRLSPHTIRGWISQKRIPYLKISRRVFLSKEQLDRLLQESVVPARPQREGG